MLLFSFSAGVGPNSKVISTVMHPHPHRKITPPVTVVLSHIKVRPLNFKRFKNKFSFRGRVGGPLLNQALLFQSSPVCGPQLAKWQPLAWCVWLSFDTIFPPVLSIDQEPTAWSTNNFLQISVFLQIIFWYCLIETTFVCANCRSVPRAVREWFDIFSRSKDQWSNEKKNDWTQLSQNIVICQAYNLSIIRPSLRLRRIIDLLATDLLNLAFIKIIVIYCSESSSKLFSLHSEEEEILNVCFGITLWSKFLLFLRFSILLHLSHVIFNRTSFTHFLFLVLTKVGRGQLVVAGWRLVTSLTQSVSAVISLTLRF